MRRYEYKPREIGILGKVADSLPYIFGVYRVFGARFVRCVERNVIEYPFHDSLQAARTDVLDSRVQIDCDIGQSVDGVIGEY